MRTKEFLSKLEHERIVDAIREAETKTAADIRLYIQRGELTRAPLAAAQARFQKLGMHKTDHRASVLIFVAPRAHKFAVVGDEAIHEKCGEVLWQEVVERMRDHFRNERFSDALVDAIKDVGAALATHFPRRSSSANQKRDDLVQG
jgi:uncharacterized membrane protein